MNFKVDDPNPKGRFQGLFGWAENESSKMTNIWLWNEEMIISDVDIMATSNPFKSNFRSNFIWPTCFFPLFKCYFLVTFGSFWWQLVTVGYFKQVLAAPKAENSILSDCNYKHDSRKSRLEFWNWLWSHQTGFEIISNDKILTISKYWWGTK